jgi:uncharacterized protein YegJ (DUF2314 family)
VSKPTDETQKKGKFGWLVVVLLVFGVTLEFYSMGAKMRARHLIRVAGSDPKLQEAVRRARLELPAFLDELKNPKPKERFAVKAAFKTDQGPEYLWIKNPTYLGLLLEGVLDQVPAVYGKARKGDLVKVEEKDVYDWLIKDDSGTRGGYTEKVLAP